MQSLQTPSFLNREEEKKQKKRWNHDGYGRTSGLLSPSLRLPRRAFDLAWPLKARQPPHKTGASESIHGSFYTAKQR